MPKPAITALAPMIMRTTDNGSVHYDVPVGDDISLNVASLYPYGTRWQLFVSGVEGHRIVAGTADAEIHILRRALTLATESATHWHSKSKESSGLLLEIVRRRDERSRAEAIQP
ncbi:hypothetical protein AB0L82_36030 [Nocardia sp. NPDC052001]|uniref:hypothetical protein n=1 Tax=Nocardia sp. NPDC052001 TaxID=3154853 RepID=UPI003437E3D0